MSWDFLRDKSVLVTGGTGSFGSAFVAATLRESAARRVIVFSRDELKQYDMRERYPDEPRLRFFIGDVRDAQRLHRAFEGVDVVIHAAAMKQIAAGEYNPIEAVKTNVHGAENVINAAIDQRVDRVLGLSTDKASSPTNLYGATKLVSDKLFVAGNAYSAHTPTKMSVVRYGNVIGSRGSVLLQFRAGAESGRIPVTDPRMTRFVITIDQAVRFVCDSLTRMHGGEIFVPKLPSMRIVDLAAAVAPDAELDVIGARPGEKLHEEMISEADAPHTVDLGDYFVIEPEMDWWSDGRHGGAALADGFTYRSDTNAERLTPAELRALIATA